MRKVLENVASVQSANVNLANETAVVRIAVRLDEEDLMEARSVGTKDAADSSDASSSAAPTVKAVNGDISVQKIIESIKNKAKIEFFCLLIIRVIITLSFAQKKKKKKKKKKKNFLTVMRIT